jgi:hypothetical protein
LASIMPAVTHRKAMPGRHRFPARDLDLAAVQAPDSRATDLDLSTVEADPPPRSAPTVRPPRRIAWRGPQAAVTSASIIVLSASIPAARQNRSKLARTSANASSTALVAG